MANRKNVKIIDIIELQEVITSPDLSTAFSFPKSGFLSLVKNFYKRAYFLELYSAIIFKNKKNDNLQPCCTINVYTYL
jgi:hypothetical protein